MNAFEHLIDRLLTDGRYQNKTRIAEALGLTVSAFDRGVKRGTLSEVNCLMLAEAADLNPSEVLRAAGKGETAAIIERLYGSGAAPPLTALDRELLSLPPGAKRQLLRLVKELGAESEEVEPERPKTHRRSA